MIERETSDFAPPPPPPPVIASTPKVQRAARRSEGESPASATLILWDLPTLEKSSDPLGQTLVSLFGSERVRSALFLAIQPPAEGSRVPLFRGAAAVLPGPSRKEKKSLWSGVSWDPKVTPDLWNQFVRTGSLELSPPATLTQASSHRNVARGAFGVQKDEWLTLVRVGSLNACRGVLAIVSTESLASEAPKALELLGRDPAPKRQAA